MIISRSLASLPNFADVLKGVGNSLFPLSASGDVNGGIFIKVFTPHPSLSLPAFTLFHAHTHILSSLASSYANSEVWECLNLECEGEITVYFNILNLSAMAIRMTCTAYTHRKNPFRFFVFQLLIGSSVFVSTGFFGSSVQHDSLCQFSWAGNCVVRQIKAGREDELTVYLHHHS